MSEKKVAVVTGSARGIGRAIADQLAQDGFAVVISDINEESAKKTAAEFAEKGYDVLAQKVDVSRQAEQKALVQAAVDKFGRLDVFVNNAGICQVDPISNISEKDLELIFKINVFGTIYGIQAATEQMVRQKEKGKIINACSIGGHQGFMNEAAYCGTKFAVRAITQTAAMEYGKYHITVNGYCPGIVQTKMLEGINKRTSELTGSTEDPFANYNIPLGRLEKPEDVAQLVSFFASDKADYITGQTVITDGGIVFA